MNGKKKYLRKNIVMGKVVALYEEGIFGSSIPLKLKLNLDFVVCVVLGAVSSDSNQTPSSTSATWSRFAGS
jgi:hypothetical protein